VSGSDWSIRPLVITDRPSTLLCGSGVDRRLAWRGFMHQFACSPLLTSMLWELIPPRAWWRLNRPAPSYLSRRSFASMRVMLASLAFSLKTDGSDEVLGVPLCVVSSAWRQNVAQKS
jgi:hypothetical protein